MGLLLADSTGPLAEFASIGGYADFREWALAQDAPALKRFVQKGYTEDLEELHADLGSIVSPAKLQAQHELLQYWVAEAKDVLIVTGEIDAEEPRALGGPGSGNFGHAGRPGETGGSSSGGLVPLTAVHIDAIQNYTAGGEINTVLRRGGALSKFDEAVRQKLDEVIASQPVLKQSTELYRVVPKEVVRKLTEGTTFTDNGFLSTTKSVAALEGIIDEIGHEVEEVAVVRITVGRNVRGLDVNKHLPKDRNNFPEQRETVLARGLKYTVQGTSVVGGHKVLDLRAWS